MFEQVVRVETEGQGNQLVVDGVVIAEYEKISDANTMARVIRNLVDRAYRGVLGEDEIEGSLSGAGSP